MEWSAFKDWWRVKIWKKTKRSNSTETEDLCFCDDCFDVCDLLFKRINILYNYTAAVTSSRTYSITRSTANTINCLTYLQFNLWL